MEGIEERNEWWQVINQKPPFYNLSYYSLDLYKLIPEPGLQTTLSKEVRKRKVVTAWFVRNQLEEVMRLTLTLTSSSHIHQPHVEDLLSKSRLNVWLGF